MGRKYAIRSQDDFYFVTFTVVYWLDIFIRREYKEIFLESLKYCQREKGLVISAYCIMTSHIHLVLGTSGKVPLEDILRDLKSYTARHIRKYMEHNPEESRREWMLWMMQRAGVRNLRNKDFQLWQQHNHPVALVTNQMVEQKINYIHNNPVVAGFVARPEDWVYSSAVDYSGLKGMVDIYFLI